MTDGNPFGPKLTHHLHYFIYAAHWYKGYPYSQLSDAFGVNDETIAKICRKNERSRFYRHVRREADLMGVDRMWEKYSSPELVERLSTSKFVPEPQSYQVQRDSGEGSYWFDDIEVEIMPYEKIKDQIGQEIDDDIKWGYWVNDKSIGLGWAIQRDMPFRSIAEALRYYAKFPPKVYP